MDPLLIDGIAAFAVFALMAGQFIGTRHLLAGQHPTTVLTWLLAVLICAPILTHRRFPVASVAVCLTAVVVYSAGHYVAYPGLAIFVLTFDIALHSRERVAVATLFASAVVIGVAVDLQPDGGSDPGHLCRERARRRGRLADRPEPSSPPGAVG